MNLAGLINTAQKHKLKYGIALISLITLITLFARLLYPRSATPQYQTTIAEKGTITASISASGQVLTSHFQTVNTSTDGIVKTVFVKDGDQVTTGQKLLEVDQSSDSRQKSASAYSSYLTAKNNLDSAQTNLYSLDSAMWAANQKFINDAVARDLETYDPTYIQQHDDWMAAEGKYKNAQSALAQSRAALSSSWLSYQATSSIVTAPSTGTITNITITPGMSIDGSSTPKRLAIITSPGNPLVSLDLTEIDINKLKIGQKATITIDSLSDKSFTGKVVAIDKIGSSTSGVTVYPVVISLDTTGDDILPNMSATANIILETKNNVVSVPSSAIRQTNGQPTVQLLVDGKPQAIAVETGISSDAYTEITSGISAGDAVIISASTTTNGTAKSAFSNTGFGASSGTRMMIAH